MKRKRKMTQQLEGRAMERLVWGAVGGIVATWGMTVAMDALFRRLPGKEQYPLPPREITETLLPSCAAPSDGTLAAGSLAAHAAYGAAGGSVFALAGLHRHRPIRRGMVWGVAVWAASYLGWLPGAQILKPATSHPLRRNLLMIAAHLVWGGTLGLTVRSLRGSMTPLRLEKRPLLLDVDEHKR